MTLNEYKKHIDILVSNGNGGLAVISSSDDEGNSYTDVHYAPGVVNLADLKNVYQGTAKDKAVCIN